MKCLLHVAIVCLLAAQQTAKEPLLQSEVYQIGLLRAKLMSAQAEEARLKEDLRRTVERLLKVGSDLDQFIDAIRKSHGCKFVSLETPPVCVK